MSEYPLSLLINSIDSFRVIYNDQRTCIPLLFPSSAVRLNDRHNYFFSPPAGFYTAARCGAEKRRAAEVTNGHRLLLLPYKASTCGVKTCLKGPGTPHRHLTLTVLLFCCCQGSKPKQQTEIYPSICYIPYPVGELEPIPANTSVAFRALGKQRIPICLVNQHSSSTLYYK